MISGNFFFKIITTQSINIKVPYTMCYPMGDYIGILVANRTKTKA